MIKIICYGKSSHRNTNETWKFKWARRKGRIISTRKIYVEDMKLLTKYNDRKKRMYGAKEEGVEIN